MVSGVEGLEAFLRVIGLSYVRRENSLVAEYRHPRLGSVGIVVSFEQDTGTVRVAVPTDVEPTREGLLWLLQENFSSTSYKYAVDYEGFITIVYDVPSACVDNARRLRELITETIHGYERLMERVKPVHEGEEGGEPQGVG